MGIEFKLPNLGEGVSSADVAEILVKEGDTISAGQIVMELETDKAVVELPCPHAGVVGRILIKEGATVTVGQPVLVIEGAGTPAAAPVAPAKTPVADAPGSPSQYFTSRRRGRPSSSRPRLLLGCSQVRGGTC